MGAYESFTILHFFKTIINTLIICFPILCTSSVMIEFLKCKLQNKRIKYIKHFSKIMISFVFMISAVYFDQNKLLSNIEFVNTWHNINNSTVLAYNEEPIDYAPVIVEPIYIRNPYKLNIEQLKTKLNNVIADKDISLSYYNLTSMQEFDINGDDKYFAASVSKIHTVLNLYDYAYENNINLDNVKMRYVASDFAGGSGILQNQSDLSNKSYSLSYLAEISIRYSDNIARNMINRYMSTKRPTVSYYKQIVGSNEVLKDKNYLMTANWATKIMKKIYYNEQNNPLYDKLIFDMKNTSSRSNIPYYLDKEIVAHKIGQMYLNGYLYSNDAAIIYSDSEYILTVFTKSRMSTQEVSEIIGTLSQIIYNEIAETQKSTYELSYNS